MKNVKYDCRTVHEENINIKDVQRAPHADGHERNVAYCASHKGGFIILRRGVLAFSAGCRLPRVVCSPFSTPKLVDDGFLTRLDEGPVLEVPEGTEW